MRTRIQKWGNSLGLRIPKSFAKEASVSDGSTVDISVNRGALVVRPVTDEVNLEDLLSQVTGDNLHEEITYAGQQGREVW